MKKLPLITLLLCFPFCVFAQTAKENGITFLRYLFQQEYEKAMTLIDESVTPQLSPLVLRQVVTSSVQQLGNYASNLDIHEEISDAFTSVFYYTKFEKQSLDIKITFSQQNKVIGFFFVPHKDFAPSLDRSHLSDYEIQSGDIKLPGTLLMPENEAEREKILAIFVHGSGPIDRDETIGGNKPFKDIGEGLLAKGIASYRYDKRSLVAPELFMNEEFTLADEVDNDVLRLVAYFQQNDTFRDYAIVLIGHSLGAMALPGIISKIPGKVAGAILLAGNARPLQELIVEQYQYLYGLQPNSALKEAVEVVNKQVAYLNSSEFNMQSPKDLLPLGLPTSYWMSLKTYDQVAVAGKLVLPLLIIQGEHDYQVLMKDFDLWQSALKGRKNVHFKSYPKLDHLLMETEKMSTPADYQLNRHVPAYLTDDLAVWLTQLR